MLKESHLVTKVHRTLIISVHTANVQYTNILMQIMIWRHKEDYVVSTMRRVITWRYMEDYYNTLLRRRIVIWRYKEFSIRHHSGEQNETEAVFCDIGILE